VKHLKVAALAVSAALAGLAGCQQKPASVEAPAAAGPALKPIASIIDLMASQVDPSADFLWESVATISTPQGMVEHQPRTDEEWLAVRMKALQLAEAANLLMVPGRRLAHEGQHLEDEGVEGNLTAEQAQVAIDTNRDTFLAFASALRDTAEKTVDAIDKRDVQAYFDLGAVLDEVCEQCHTKFWYPGATPPPSAKN